MCILCHGKPAVCQPTLQLSRHPLLFLTCRKPFASRQNCTTLSCMIKDPKLLLLSMPVCGNSYTQYASLGVSMQSNPSSGISSNMYICLLGLLPAVWSLLGYDSTAHMIEETKEADAVAGWPMPYAVALSGISGFPFLIALTLCIQVALTSAVMCHVSLVPTSYHAHTNCAQKHFPGLCCPCRVCLSSALWKL